MAAFNKSFFIGRIGNDLEPRTTNTGKNVVNFSLAVSEKYGGNEKTTWLRCQAWEKTCDVICKYCKKGSQIFIEASYQINEWTDKEGKKRETPEFVIRSMQMLDSKKDSQQSSNQGYQGQDQYPGQNSDGPTGQGQDDFIEDDIPF